MSASFRACEVAAMQAAQSETTMDSCQIGSYDSVVDDYGNPTPQYTYGEATACGLAYLKPEEQMRSGEVPVIDARLRLALGTTIGVQDRVRLTHRYGTELVVPEVFDVIGPIQDGPSGLVVNLALVTNE